SKNTQNYYYYRMTEYIMWALLQKAIQMDDFSQYEHLLTKYFHSSAHKEMMDEKTFRRVYIAYCMRETNYEFYTQYSSYYKKALGLVKPNMIEKLVFNGNVNKLKYNLYKMTQKSLYFIKRLKGKLQRLMRK